MAIFQVPDVEVAEYRNCRIIVGCHSGPSFNEQLLGGDDVTALIWTDFVRHSLQPPWER
jgi:hypothetical protein